MPPPVIRSAPPPPDGGILSSAAAPWTGEKKRKTTVGPPSPPPGLASSSSSGDATDQAMPMPMDIVGLGPGQEPDDEESVFSAQDDIDGDEAFHHYEQLQKRDGFLEIMRSTSSTRMGDKDTDETYKRLCELRYRDYKQILKGDYYGLSNPGASDDTLDAQALSMDPTDDCPWDNIFEPGPSIFGWSYDPSVTDFYGLDDYQRIIPTRVDFYEYHRWDDYRSTLSDYKTDQEYVKYCDEMSKKMKWVEESMRQNKEEFEEKFETRSRRQALKIAEGFPHLTYTSAQRGIDEYVLTVAYKLDTEDYARVYFEVWERVCRKKEMSFEDALKSALPAFEHTCGSRIRGQLLGYHNLVLDEFKACTDQVSSHITDKAGVLKHITDAVYKIKSAERPKFYLDFVKKKSEVARRLQLSPDEGTFCIGKY